MDRATILETCRAELYSAVVSDTLDALGYRRQVVHPGLEPLQDGMRIVGFARVGIYMPIYHDDETWLPEDLLDRILGDSVKINRALGYDMNSVEFAIRDGVPYAIDFTNPAPDMHIEHLRERYFNIAVENHTLARVE